MNNLKLLRKQKKLTQQELAEVVNIPKRTIQRLENSESQISIGKAEKLAEYFGVSVGYLLGLDTPARDGIAGVSTRSTIGLLVMGWTRAILKSNG